MLAFEFDIAGSTAQTSEVPIRGTVPGGIQLMNCSLPSFSFIERGTVIRSDYCAVMSLKHRLSLIIAMPLALYLALAPMIAWPLYSSILFQPRPLYGSDEAWKSLESDFKVKREEVSFPSSDGTIIRGWFFRLPKSNRVFLVSQGKGSSLSNRAGMARMLLHCGGSVFIYNYRGLGKSEGRPSLDGICLDAVAAYDFLVREKGFPASGIIAYGESFGSGVTGQLVSLRPVGGVIMQSGFSSLLRASRDVLPWLHFYPDSWFPKQMLDNVAVFSKPHPPLLIIHGKKDQLVSCQNANDLFQAACEPKTLLILKDGEHGSFGKGNDYFIAVGKFLKDHQL